MVVNTLAAPLLAPLPAVSSVPVELSTPVGQLPPGHQFDVAEAPSVHAEAEVNEQQQWWQQDQQVQLLGVTACASLSVHNSTRALANGHAQHMHAKCTKYPRPSCS
jgi:hypothetical protein